MTGVRKTTDRAAKWMRYIARALAVIWALFWTYFVGLVWLVLGRGAPFGAPTPPPTPPVEFFLEYFGLRCLVAWVSLAIAWRWEVIGGVALLLAGLSSFFRFGGPTDSVRLLALHLPPFAAGILFLASWWKSRTAETPQNSA